MGNVNKAIIVGNLGGDPTLRDAGSNKVCNFSVATNEKWKDKSGDQQEKTEWHKIVVWGKRGENCAKYLKSGSPVYIEGRIQHRSYEDQDGNKRYVDEIVANDVQFLSASGGSGRGGGGDHHGRGGREDYDDDF